MPCRDWDDSKQVVYQEDTRKVRKLEAMLCALLTVLKSSGMDDDLIARTNPESSGVSHKEFRRWWAYHQEQDALRIARETKKAQDNLFKEKALKKLTPAERKALGV